MILLLSLKQCTFCGKDIPIGSGTMFAKNDGSVQWFCSSKCRKNLTELKRDYRKYKWSMRGKMQN